jgi:hypothetical protein
VVDGDRLVRSLFDFVVVLPYCVACAYTHSLFIHFDSGGR